ncbi:glycosyltransferase [Actinoplanes sp. NBC_00393]|uniref:glycosyltransferase n=1 Tax=Actinoplanes sp. NBC_00393 TaxID=2975953 RepID=UPI002E2273FC
MVAVLHVTQPTTGGVGRVVLGLARAQADAGLDVTVACPAGPLAGKLANAGVRWERWESDRQPGRSVAAEMGALDRIITAGRPDLVHLHSSKAGLVGRLAVRGRRPTVFQPHAWSFLAATGKARFAAIRWERYATRWTDLTLYCSGHERAEGIAHGVAGPGRLVLNGVDLDHFHPSTEPERQAARDALDLPADKFVAAVVGRRSEQKGQDIAVQAWRRIRAAEPNAMLLLVGDGYRDARDSRAGVVTRAAREDVRPVFQAADIMVSPSRWEGLSLSLLEGMAAGRPTVATDVAGSREALLDGPLAPGGTVVPAADEDALTEAVLMRLRRPDLTAREGAAARRRAEAAFSEAATTDSVVEAYRLLLARL